MEKRIHGICGIFNLDEAYQSLPQRRGIYAQYADLWEYLARKTIIEFIIGMFDENLCHCHSSQSLLFLIIILIFYRQKIRIIKHIMAYI